MDGAVVGACMKANDEADAEEIGTSVEGDRILKDDVETPKYTSTYIDYRRTCERRSISLITMGCLESYFGCGRCVDVEPSFTVGTDEMVSIWGPNERCVEKEFEL